MPQETIILRFRDLSTNAGGTVLEHNNVLREKGAVWWGWWHKAGETVPINAFAKIQREASTDGALVYLLDTGQGKAYRAKIRDIEWEKARNPMHSPDVELTPVYYSGKKCVAWFKFSDDEITEVEEADLLSFTYHREPELFENRHSIFEKFYDKKIFSIEELRHQERSLWFVRRSQYGDASYEIRLYDKFGGDPSDFPAHVIDSDGECLLWLSDVHFSDEHHNFSLTAGQHHKTLSEVIREDWERLDKPKPIAGLVISGDLTWRASSDEFGYLREFLKDVSSWASLSNERILVCPGNHDIAYSEDPANKSGLVQRSPEQARQAYSEFYSDFYGLSPNEYLCSGRRFLLGRRFSLEIAALNSSFLSQEPGVFQGHGYVGEEQLKLVEEKMRWREGDSHTPFRILVLHHHLAPVVPIETPWREKVHSIVFDAAHLTRWAVSRNVSLVLHGHMHHSAHTVVRIPNPLQENGGYRDIFISALGSSGVKIDHTSDRRNVYGVIEVVENKLLVQTREIQPVGVVPPAKARISYFEV